MRLFSVLCELLVMQFSFGFSVFLECTFLCGVCRDVLGWVWLVNLGSITSLKNESVPRACFLCLPSYAASKKMRKWGQLGKQFIVEDTRKVALTVLRLELLNVSTLESVGKDSNIDKVWGFVNYINFVNQLYSFMPNQRNHPEVNRKVIFSPKLKMN